ncbi:hypothetical protein HK102_001135, partial [Quaeritorhiza haematococci]
MHQNHRQILCALSVFLGVVATSAQSINKFASAVTGSEPLFEPFSRSYGGASFLQNVGNATVPGTEGTQEIATCIYPRSSWPCPPGYFCLQPGMEINENSTCTPGFLCPENTFSPVYCCEGYYCPNTTAAVICPPNHLCPMGTVHPVPCNFLSFCPEGSTKIPRFGIAFILLLVLAVIRVLFICRRFFVLRKNAKYRDRLLSVIKAKKKVQQQRQQQSSVLITGEKGSAHKLKGRSEGGSNGDEMHHASGNSSGGFPSRNSRLQVVPLSVVSSVDGVKTDDGKCGNSDDGAATVAVEERSDVTATTEKDQKKPRRWMVKQGEKNICDEETQPSGDVLPPNPLGQPNFHISFESIGYALPKGQNIIQKISGAFGAGRTTAIMGPSGAGKTTLISTLTGKVKRTSGRITINGVEDELAKYRKLIGHVPQEDVMLRELTVRDILMHSAMMRLPADWSAKRKKQIVLEVISFLGLSHVMDNVIGSEEERGISGGQRKRVNIGMELVACPSVLFLDEPTSGLDSATSLDVCAMLKEIASRNKMTVAAVIHSPPQQAFEQFDDVLLLGQGGRVVYFGPREDAVAYFERLGFVFPVGYNPADFMMDVITGRVACQLQDDFEPQDLFGCWEEYQNGRKPEDLLMRKSPSASSSSSSSINEGIDSKATPPPTSSLIVTSSPRYGKRMCLAGTNLIIRAEDGIRSTKDFLAKNFSVSSMKEWFAPDPVRQTPNTWAVLLLCYQRATRQIYRSPATFIFDQIMNILCGAAVSIAGEKLIYLGAQPEGICQYTVPLLQRFCLFPFDTMKTTAGYVAMGALLAGTMSGAPTFGNEKVVLWRDVSVGMPVLPYFLAKHLADIPRMLLGAVMFSSAVSLFLPYQGHWFNLYLIIQLQFFVAFSMAYFLAAVVPRNLLPLASMVVPVVWNLALAGVNPSLTDIQQGAFKYFQWLWAISPPRWAIEAIYINEARARPWKELQENRLLWGYSLDNFDIAVKATVYIGVG